MSIDSGNPATAVDDLTLLRQRFERSAELGRVNGSSAQPKPESLSPVPTALSGDSASLRGSAMLRVALIVLDSIALGGSWIPSFIAPNKITGSPPGTVPSLLLAMAITSLISLGLIASQGLYLSRVASVKAVELARLWRVALLSGLVGAGVSWRLGHRPSLLGAVINSALAFAFLTFERNLFRGWLSAQRRQGRFTRGVVIVGANEDGLSWCRLFDSHPELGFRVRGLVGDADPRFALGDGGPPWLGRPSEVTEAVRSSGATGVIIASTALSPAQMNQVIREMFEAKVHIQVYNGLQGIATRRLNVMSLARESVFYVERQHLSAWQLCVKRVLDVAISAVVLLFALPVMAVAAIAIKLDDHGPIRFKQVRIGRGEKPFTLYKLRTMRTDAESRKNGLVCGNQRSGPLFKLAEDPRVTRVGRFLRATSIDELPQLFNVFEGNMSLVGPRPALASEVAQFDDALLARHDWKPGITGLWQIEARDSPSFDSYQRLDIHYVENWSILLDLAIMMSTTASVLARTLRTLCAKFWRSNPVEEPAGYLILD